MREAAENIKDNLSDDRAIALGENSEKSIKFVILRVNLITRYK